jgi:hypothetical protein
LHITERERNEKAWNAFYDKQRAQGDGGERRGADCDEKTKKKKRLGLLTRRGHRAIIMMIKYFIISFEKEKQKC